jgi:hypothetical protein
MRWNTGRCRCETKYNETTDMTRQPRRSFMRGNPPILNHLSGVDRRLTYSHRLHCEPMFPSEGEPRVRSPGQRNSHSASHPQEWCLHRRFYLFQDHPSLLAQSGAAYSEVSEPSGLTLLMTRNVSVHVRVSCECHREEATHAASTEPCLGLSALQWARTFGIRARPLRTQRSYIAG